MAVHRFRAGELVGCRGGAISSLCRAGAISFLCRAEGGLGQLLAQSRTFLQWIYDIIIEHDPTVELAWNQRFDIFFDNKNSRTLYLEQGFSRVKMVQSHDVSSYYQHIKSLLDQLCNVGTLISNEQMVLQHCSMLTLNIEALSVHLKPELQH
jgi:hypothetical protein